MIYLQDRRLEKTERGGGVVAVELPDRRFILSRSVPRNLLRSQRERAGFTLIELVITVTVLSILTLGIVPLLKLSVTRQKEQQLRDSLRQMRTAIDEFHRDTIGMNCTGTAVTAGAPAPGPAAIDPRSKVVISDCTIFGVDNPDRYPPDLQTLVDGVNVIPRGAGAAGAGVQGVNATDVGNPQLSTKKKVYLRGIPINPFTGGNEMGRDWELRSCYDSADSDSWGGENAFDVVFPHSKDQNFKPLKEGDKYSDW